MLKYSASLPSLTLHQLPYGVLEGMDSAREDGFLDLLVYPAEYVAFHPDAGADLCQGVKPSKPMENSKRGVFILF